MKGQSEMKQYEHSLKISRCFRITAIFTTLIFMQSSLFAGEDISGLLAKKGPAAKEVLTKPTITRITDLPNLPVSSKQYEFFIEHPRLSIILARICDPSLDLYSVSVRPDGLIHVDDPAGLAGDVEVISASRGKRVYFISGYYDLLKIRFHGHVLMVTEYSEKKVGDTVSVDTKVTNYIKVNSAVAGAFARIINFLFPKKVDGRIGRFANAVRIVAFSVNSDPDGAYNKLAVSGEVDLKELKEFAAMFVRKREH